MSWAELVWRQARVHRGTLATLGALVLITTFLAAAAPRAVTAGYDDALAKLLQEAPDLRKDITVFGSLAGSQDTAEIAELDTAAKLEQAGEDLGRQIQAPLRQMMGEPIATGRSQTLAILDRLIGAQRGSQFINLRYDSDVPERIRYVEGAAPGAGGTVEVFEGGGASITLDRIDIAVSRRTAEQMKFEVGDQLRVRTKPSLVPIPQIELVARISGIFEPIDAAEPVWSYTPSLLGAQLRPVALGGQDIEATGILSAESYASFARMAGPTPRFVWRYHFDFSQITVAQIDQALNAVNHAVTQIPEIDESTPALNLSAITFLRELITGFEGQRRTAHTILSLSGYAIIAVAIVVLALAAQLAAEQRRASLALIRARGGSLMQATGLVVIEIAMVAIPAAVASYVAATWLVPTRSAVPSSTTGVLVIAAAAVLLPAAFAAFTHRRVAKDERRDLVSIRPSPRRLAAEALVVTLAAAGAYTLHTRGLTTAAEQLGTDPYLVSVPVLIALAAGLLALRAYPYPLRALGQLTSARRGAVGFVGVARASREASPAALPLLALLMTLGLGIFGSVLDTSVSRSMEQQTWRDIGADARLEGFGFDDAAVARLAEVPGVNTVIRSFQTTDADLRIEGITARPVALVAVDSAGYAPLLRRIGLDLPLPPSGAMPGPTGALLSPALAQGFGDNRELSVQWGSSNVDIEIVGTIERFPGVAPGWDLVVLPYEPAEVAGASPTVLFIDGPDVPGDALRTAAADELVSVATRADRLAELGDNPLTRLILSAFRLGLLALAAYSVLAILLGLVLGADRRGRVVSYLRTLGLSQRQSYGLLLLEIGPLVALAVVAGLVVGLLISLVVSSGVDLRPFTGTADAPPLAVDVGVLSLLAAALIALVAIAIVVDAALNRRRQLGSVLRVGEQ
ncbi:MAG: FtsX-like permease family protein [Sporichthyaceae bacterium]|nr:FtsX-like permease family protein [Sporichthyaceae bacterium]